MRIARRLILAGAYLKREQKCFGLMVKRNRWPKAVMKCSEQYVENLFKKICCILIPQKMRNMSSPTRAGHFICLAKRLLMLF